MFIPVSGGSTVKIGSQWADGRASKGKGKKGKGKGGDKGGNNADLYYANQGGQEAPAGEHYHPANDWHGGQGSRPNQYNHYTNDQTGGSGKGHGKDQLTTLIEAIKSIAQPPATPQADRQAGLTTTPSISSPDSASLASGSQGGQPPGHRDDEQENPYQRWKNKKAQEEPAERDRPQRERNSSHNSRWGRPEWFVSSRGFEDECIDGSIQVKADRKGVYARVELDWGGLHLRGLPESWLMESSKPLTDDSCRLRIVGICCTPEEVKTLNAIGHVTILPGYPPHLEKIDAIMKRYFWHFLSSNDLMEFEKMITDFTTRMKLRPTEEAVTYGDAEEELIAVKMARRRAEEEKGEMADQLAKMQLQMQEMMVLMHQTKMSAVPPPPVVPSIYQTGQPAAPPADDVLTAQRNSMAHPTIFQNLGTPLFGDVHQHSPMDEDTLGPSAPGPSPASWKKNTTKADDPSGAWKSLKPTGEKKTSKDTPAKVSKAAEKTDKTAKRHLTRNSCKDLKTDEDTQAWCPPGGADEEEFL